MAVEWTLLPIIPIIISIVAALAAYLLWRTTSKMLASQNTFPLLNDYRSDTMGTSIIKLHDFGRSVKLDKIKIMKEYSQQFTLDTKNHTLGPDSLHFCRRRVSQFYAILSAFYCSDFIVRKFVLEYWHAETVKIIKDIIIPCEIVLVLDRSEPDITIYNNHILQRQYKFYKAAVKKYKRKDKVLKYKDYVESLIKGYRDDKK